MCEELRRKIGGAVCALALLLALQASAASISDFTLSGGALGTTYDLSGPQFIFDMLEVGDKAPGGGGRQLVDPQRDGLSIHFLVSRGTIVENSISYDAMFFEFINRSTSPNGSAVLMEIWFETNGLLEEPTAMHSSGTQVDYALDYGNPGDFGTGFGLNFDVEADPNEPNPVANGLGVGENLLVGFAINSSSSYDALLSSLLLGGPDGYNGWTIAGHAQSLENGDSAWVASTNPQDVPPPPPPNDNLVPIPGAAGLGLLGFGMVAFLRRKRVGGLA